MKITAKSSSGNSSKFQIVTKRGGFVIALSFTLRTKIWGLADADGELVAAQQLAEAIVSRHDPTAPFRPLYIFAEHNSLPSLEKTVQRIRTHGYDRLMD